MLTIIRFKDNGQDFLMWEVAPDGSIINCTPFQASIWTKFKVTNLPDLKKGGYVDVLGSNGPLTIKHKIDSVEVRNEKVNRLCTQCDTVFAPKSSKNFKCSNCGAHFTEYTAAAVRPSLFDRNKAAKENKTALR